MESFLRLNTVLQRTGLSRTRLYDKIKTGEFPHQVKIGPRSVAWPESQVNAWMQKKMENDNCPA